MAAAIQNVGLRDRPVPGLRPLLWLVTLLAVGAPPARADFDLSADWSDAQNPNGPWTYREGFHAMPQVTAWQAWSPAQPAWAHHATSNQRLPVWFKSTSERPEGWPVGDVIVHTTDGFNGVGHGIANLLWTSPIAGVIDLEGALWMTRDIGRSNHWTLYVNGAEVTGGDLASGDPYSRDKPLRLDQGSGGPSAVQGIHVVPGDSLVLAFVKTSSAGDFIGVTLHIAVRSLELPRTLAWWRFEESAGPLAPDSSGNGNHGTYFGAAALSALAPSTVISTGALNLSSLGLGGGDAVTVPDSPTLRPLNAITVEAWVRPVADEGWVVMAKQFGFECCANSYSIELRSGEIHWILSTDQSTQATVTYPDVLPRHHWSHLAGTWDGEIARLYVNGELKAQLALTGTLLYDAEPVNIGCDSDASSGEPQCCWFYGGIDEMRISSVALAPTELETVDVPSAAWAREWIRLTSHPNPSSDGQLLEWTMPEAGDARLTLYDAAGRAVRTLVRDALAAGPHRVAWDGRDDRGARVGPGIYLARLWLTTGERPVVATRKLLVLR